MSRIVVNLDGHGGKALDEFGQGWFPTQDLLLIWLPCLDLIHDSGFITQDDVDCIGLNEGDEVAHVENKHWRPAAGQVLLACMYLRCFLSCSIAAI